MVSRAYIFRLSNIRSTPLDRGRLYRINICATPPPDHVRDLRDEIAVQLPLLMEHAQDLFPNTVPSCRWQFTGSVSQGTKTFQVPIAWHSFLLHKAR